MEETVEYIEINNINYIIVDEIYLDGNNYLFLSNEDDENDFFVRKEIIENGEKYIVGLDSDEEVVKVSQAFLEKNANQIND